MTTERDFYCNKKFTYIRIDLEKRLIFNCHAAQPHKVPKEWLVDTSGLFNNPISISERKMMLKNERAPSCDQNCGPAEDTGSVSPRLYQKGYIRSHDQVITDPESVDVIYGSECALTCSYCNKGSSSSWRADLVNNGEYPIIGDDDRYKLSTEDMVLQGLSQSTKSPYINNGLIMDQINYWVTSTDLRELIVTGGEPLLNKSFLELLKKAKPTTKIIIFTGLGISDRRLQEFLDELKRFDNVELVISSECTEKFLEFNRYGVKWDNFLHKIEMIKSSGVNFLFSATLSNLTLFGFGEFYRTFIQVAPIVMGLVYNPDFMAPYVLDDKSKEMIAESLAGVSDKLADQIKQSIKASATDTQKANLKTFLLEFTRRRPDLDLGIYPKHFLEWAHVVQ